MSARSVVVADIGGTTLRVGRWEPVRGEVRDVRRSPVEGLARYPAESPQQLQDRVVEQLVKSLADYLAAVPDASAVGLSFAGPIDARGTVLAAPTIWGSGGRRLPLGQVLRQRLDRPVVVANDITAAAWRYAPDETDPFCVITISSGIGNKVFRGGEVLVDPLGHGGELGHWQVDPAPDAAPCDCGGRGHLGAIASGRGILSAARRAAISRPHEYARSALADLVPDPAALTNEALVLALRADDGFATAVLRRCLRYLAMAITCVFTAIGIRQYILIGGFVVALGERFVRCLTAQLQEAGCFGLDAEQIGRMVRLGALDDDHGLIGIGRLASGHAVTLQRGARPVHERRQDAHPDHR